jgi:hypothetical protein
MVIVDSSMALFRVDFSGRGQLADRQVKSVGGASLHSAFSARMRESVAD